MRKIALVFTLILLPTMAFAVSETTFYSRSAFPFEMEFGDRFRPNIEKDVTDAFKRALKLASQFPPKFLHKHFFKWESKSPSKKVSIVFSFVDSESALGRSVALDDKSSDARTVMKLAGDTLSITVYFFVDRLGFLIERPSEFKLAKLTQTFAQEVFGSVQRYISAPEVSLDADKKLPSDFHRSLVQEVNFQFLQDFLSRFSPKSLSDEEFKKLMVGDFEALQIKRSCNSLR